MFWLKTENNDHAQIDHFVDTCLKNNLTFHFLWQLHNKSILNAQCLSKMWSGSWRRSWICTWSGSAVTMFYDVWLKIKRLFLTGDTLCHIIHKWKGIIVFPSIDMFLHLFSTTAKVHLCHTVTKPVISTNIPVEGAAGFLPTRVWSWAGSLVMSAPLLSSLFFL